MEVVKSTFFWIWNLKKVGRGLQFSVWLRQQNYPYHIIYSYTASWRQASQIEKRAVGCFQPSGMKNQPLSSSSPFLCLSSYPTNIFNHTKKKVFNCFWRVVNNVLLKMKIILSQWKCQSLTNIFFSSKMFVGLLLAFFLSSIAFVDFSPFAHLDVRGVGKRRSKSNPTEFFAII